jgi:hypothetical protein
MKDWINTPESSNIKRWKYDADTETLTVEFNYGAQYSYDGVPQRVVDVMAKAESTGKYFNEHIKKAGYKFTKL